MSDSSKQTSNDTNLKYWVNRWQDNRIGFHRSDVNELFKKHLLSKLNSSQQQQQQCVAFTLCGKSLDMTAVLAAGHQVIGIEGCQMAIEAFFSENQISYEIEKDQGDQCVIYKGTDCPVTIYCVDFYSFNQSLPRIDYIWDRGGLVAVDPSTREQYRDKLLQLMTPGHTELFVVAMNDNEPTFTGPPHRVTDDDMRDLFESKCSIQLLEVHDETDAYNARMVARRIDFIEERLHSIILKAI